MRELVIKDNPAITINPGVVTFHALEGDESVPFDKLQDGEKRLFLFIGKYSKKSLKGVKINK